MIRTEIFLFWKVYIKLKYKDFNSCRSMTKLTNYWSMTKTWERKCVVLRSKKPVCSCLFCWLTQQTWPRHIISQVSAISDSDTHTHLSEDSGLGLTYFVCERYPCLKRAFYDFSPLADCKLLETMEPGKELTTYRSSSSGQITFSAIA